MSKLIVLVGLPGSGKSTLAQKLKIEYKAEIISSDTLRKELYGTELDQNHNSEVFAEMQKRTIDLLKLNKNVIYDATNINSRKRMHLLRCTNKYTKTAICYFLATPYEMCLERNNQRVDRKVPEEVIKRMLYSFHTPSIREGFKEIKVIYPENYQKNLDVEFLPDIPHDNPNHTLSVKEHMQETFTLASKKATVDGFEQTNSFKLLEISSYYHDLGKFYTKVFDEKGIAHYYNHENVGAYKIFEVPLNSLDDNELLKVSLLINWHMRPYSWKSKEDKEKAQKFLGPKLFNILTILHECDKEAH